jgi:hypothetical protein
MTIKSEPAAPPDGKPDRSRSESRSSGAPPWRVRELNDMTIVAPLGLSGRHDGGNPRTLVRP